ncbi:MAG: Phosphate metabolism transcription protein [Peltula sp. TS41687]|nr:MAG: Phosphate metabolism transcription protein [Peltula sp. TS41687]
MRFGKTLRRSIHEPWKPHYIEYDKLKRLLRDQDNESDEGGSSLRTSSTGQDDRWTEDDESAFVEELVNVQLEKVYSFQVEKYQELRDRTSQCELKLEEMVQHEPEQGNEDENAEVGEEPSRRPSVASQFSQPERQKELREIIEELDDITREINRLEQFSRINFTGFLKAAKKHDRKRGAKYRVRPLLEVRLGALPFNSEDYSPLLYRLSNMYSFVRQNLDDAGVRSQSVSDAVPDEVKHLSHKFWIHPDNVLEVKTYILRRLPLLVYNPQSSKIADGSYDDPTITSLYFDDSKFSLYTEKVERIPHASSLRLRWYGKLNDNPEVMFEKKTVIECDDSNTSDIRFPIKAKYVEPFIKGEYKMERSLSKIGNNQQQNVNHFQRSVKEIQDFILSSKLQPMVRANYTRTAFQIPGDDRVRISLDTNLALIKEDALSVKNPSRPPSFWHRTDIDDQGFEYPFSAIPASEKNLFPYALLEIKLRDSPTRNLRTTEWITDLTTSHLVKDAPRFSKFVHGIASLFEDQVNVFPFWLSEVGKDIRREPDKAFQEELERKKRREEDEVIVGSYLGGIAGSRPSPGLSAGFTLGSTPEVTSPGRPKDSRALLVEEAKRQALTTDASTKHDDNVNLEDDDEDDAEADVFTEGQQPRNRRSRIAALLGTRRHSTRYGAIRLPPGIRAPDPAQLLKNMGPIRVEPKVWLANERTFIKWQHVAILMATLSVELYNTASTTTPGRNVNNVARNLAVVYTLFAIFASLWGWRMYVVRRKLIEQRSGKDFDNVLGPVVVCVGLIVGLVINWVFTELPLTMMSSEFNSTDYASGWVQGPMGRGTWEILYSNVLTLGLCVFTAIHLNVDSVGTTELQYWLHKCKWVLITVLFPEITLYTAGKQWFTANRVRKKLNAQLNRFDLELDGLTTNSLPRWRRSDLSTQGVPADASRKKSPCSMIYAHYVVMGGFVTDVSHLHDSLSRLTISSKGVAFLAKHGHFLRLPEVTIRDKSKADLLSKALVCFQVTWQLIQTIARWATGIPLTLLEVHIFLHIACALAMYGLWVSKPLDVRDPTVVDPSEFQDLLALMLMRNYGFGRKARRADSVEESLISIRATDHSHHNGSESSYLHLYPTSTDDPGQDSEPEKTSSEFLPRVVTHYPGDGFDFSLFPRRSLGVCTLISGQSLGCGIGPALSVCSLNGPSSMSGENNGRLAVDLSDRDIQRWNLAAVALGRAGEPFHHSDESVNYFTTHAPNIFLDRKGLQAGFYGYFRAWASGGLIAALSVCGFYGAVHITAWNFRFPTAIERFLWRAACIDTIAGTISLLTLFSVVIYLREHDWRRLVKAFCTPEPGWMPYLFRSLIVLGLLNVPLFLASRLYILVETFISLRHVPKGIYQTVQWTDYIPHI